MKKTATKKHPAHKNPSTSHRFSKEAREMVSALAQQMGISQTAVFELAIRRLAKSEGLEI